MTRKEEKIPFTVLSKLHDHHSQMTSLTKVLSFCLEIPTYPLDWVLRLVLSAVTTSPAVEKTLSEGTEVPGMAK